MRWWTRICGQCTCLFNVKDGTFTRMHLSSKASELNPFSFKWLTRLKRDSGLTFANNVSRVDLFLQEKCFGKGFNDLLNFLRTKGGCGAREGEEVKSLTLRESDNFDCNRQPKKGIAFDNLPMSFATTN